MRMKPNKRNHLRCRAKSWLVQGIILLFVALTLYPFGFMLLTSLKDNDQFFQSFWSLPQPVVWDNYVQAFAAIRGYILNSFIVTITAVFFTVLLASLSAYVLGRYRFPGSKVLFYLIVGYMMAPSFANLVPAFMLAKRLGLLDSYLVMILPTVAGGQFFAIFVLKSFFEGLPDAIFETARIDGANELQVWWHLLLPMSRPILATIAIISFIGAWNDYLWPLITVFSDELRTIPIGLAFFQTEYQTNYGALMAGYVLASVPLLVMLSFTMRQFISGMSSGAIKA